jgi:hypothetical protein
MILLDVDGVLADTVGALVAYHDDRDPDVRGWWPRGEYSIEKVLGLTAAELWGPCGRGFWATLPMTSHALELIELCRSWPGGFMLATSPLSGEHAGPCVAGKLAWIQRHFGEGFRDYMIGSNKHVMARHPGAILIDDFEGNVDKFNDHGGRGILFPAPWNKLHSIANPLAHVRQMLEQCT